MHPLLTQDDDLHLRCKLDEYSGTVVVPGITCQYDRKGELYNGSIYDYCYLWENTPADFKKKFHEQWKERGAELWDRLLELLRDQRQRLPGNCFVEKACWIAGIIDTPPDDVAKHIAKIREKIAASRSAQAQRAKLFEIARVEGRRVVIGTYLTDGCRNGHDGECSFDSATVFACPDGTQITIFTCCY